ncbi:right-handed parallel beta-helix repeat-containing protein [Flammeovirga sp. OC4]|uniref:right-handed parallel beta-helix repeat-containing protein n=1 Tax=Flammeovirga sp. OC4 TaxID=1382345 RepID=UPI0005C59D04|nr:right-handed parallel beta-helix repeat-containing protein [Flammeovirga sp. OC4]
MKKLIYLTIGVFLTLTSSVSATNYYIDGKGGNDDNNGLSKQQAFKTLQRINEVQLKAGDKVRLANGSIYRGSLILKNILGSKKRWVTISNYTSKNHPSNVLPHIDAKGFDNAIFIENSKFISISNLELSANGGQFSPKKNKKDNMRCGVLFLATDEGTYTDIELHHLKVSEVYLMEEGYVRGKKEVFTPNGTQGYGWGIRFLSKNKEGQIQNITIRDCEVSNVTHTGIKVNGKGRNIKDVSILNNRIFKTGGPGMQFGGMMDGHIAHNSVDHSGNNEDSRKWGRGSGLWTWGCDRVLIEHNEFRNANGPADSAGCHIDFNCSNVIVQFNLSVNNAGGFCEILGNNYNCAYRYNVSVNDGHRVKKKGVASQEGKVFWLSGFNGKGKERKGPYNSYFYNNTIYVKGDQQVKVAVDRASKGVLIANNIFYIEGTSKQVLGDQYKPEKQGESLLEHIIFENNLFLKEGNWPKEASIQDENPTFGDPKFINKNGTELVDYIPQNKLLIQGKGIDISLLPQDIKGLYIGMEVKKDILGNKLNGKPDFGAIQFDEKLLKTQ